MEQEMKFDLVGTFEVTSGELVISDPCYSLGTWCQGRLSVVKLGTWNAYAAHVESHGRRVAAIVAVHKDHVDDSICSSEWRRLPEVIGVDSGQAGFFDLAAYKNSSLIIEEPKFSLGNDWAPDARWYAACCDITLGSNDVGVLPGGVVSSSGYGDGSYEAYYLQDSDLCVVAVSLDFILYDDEEDEEDCGNCEECPHNQDDEDGEEE